MRACTLPVCSAHARVQRSYFYVHTCECSIINGFAVPIKEEHKVMMTRALLPLHKAKAIMPFHPQLSYCMVLYVAKDHELTREVVNGLLRFWPFGNSQKQLMFLNELEDIFEYVQEDDVPYFRDALALRLAKCIGGLHFQVAERTLLLWNCDRFVVLLSESEANRQAMLPILFPALYTNQASHWHESIRILSQRVLEQYADIDSALYQQCMLQFEERLAEQEAAEAAAEAGMSFAAAPAHTATPAASSQLAGTPSPSGEAPSLGTPRKMHITPGFPVLGMEASGSLEDSVPLPASPSPNGLRHVMMPISPAAAAALHAHKAPAVRAASGFGSMPDADLLPPAAAARAASPGRRERMPQPLASPLTDDEPGAASR